MTGGELHLIVLWECARDQESRILADIPNQVEVVHSTVLNWPSEAAACYARFYGANLEDVACKVRTCGSGGFRIVIVRDREPVYGLKETSRGLESVNLKLFAMKMRYREWTGGGHKVHTTNSRDEARRDILLMTGHPLEAWEKGCPEGPLTVLTGQGGWQSLREMFGFLGRLSPYVVLRNAETLPDRFVPDLHGDIDLLVPDAEACARLLCARKVFPQDYRVHYEVLVAGRPVRLDLRYVGDGYYDARWEQKLLERRVERDGVCVLDPENAFFALAYHAFYQKREIAADYPPKLAALAKVANITGSTLEDWLLQLEEFLACHHYESAPARDESVFWNTRLVRWRALAAEIASISGVEDIRPACLAELRAATPLRTFFFSGKLDGKPCFVKYSPVAPKLTAAEWSFPQMLQAKDADRHFVRSLFWHVTRDGGAFVVQERVEGRSMETLLRGDDPLLVVRAKEIAESLVKIAETLNSAGLIHRDVRPANLLVGEDGHVTLIDFQLATRRESVKEEGYVQRNPRILYVLGAEYALGHGKWNDAHSLIEVLKRLPASSARDEAIARLRPQAMSPVAVARCDKETMHWMRRRLARLRRRKLASVFSRRVRSQLGRRFEVEFETLSYAVANWLVV